MSTSFSVSMLAILALIAVSLFISNDEKTHTTPHNHASTRTPNEIRDHTEESESHRSKNRQDLKSITKKNLKPKESDYSYLKGKLSGMTLNERLDFLANEICDTGFGSGGFSDLSQKILLINEFGGKRSEYLRGKLLTSVFLESDPSNDSLLFEDLDRALWTEGLKAAAIDNPAKSFEIATSILDIERQEIGIRTVTSLWLGLDSVAASEAIAAMPAGYIRDCAIAEMVGYLVRTGSKAEAIHWEAAIEDPKIRSQVVRIMGEKSEARR